MNLIKSTFLLVLVASSLWTQAQEKNVDKALRAYEDKFYERALGLIEKAIEDPETRKDPEVYIIASQIILALQDNEFWVEDNPKSIETAVKYCLKAKRYDKKNEVVTVYKDVWNKVSQANFEMAEDQYKKAKYFKAQRLFRSTYEMTQDTAAYYWVGRIYLNLIDTASALPYIDTTIIWYDAAFAAGQPTESFLPDPYLYYGEKYWNSAEYDKAKDYLLRANKIFPKNDRVSFYLNRVFRNQINDLEPSQFMKEKINTALDYFPHDTFFISKYNAMSLYSMNKSLALENYADLDSTIETFKKDKVNLAKSNPPEVVKSADFFLEDKAENVLWKLIEYADNFGHNDLANYAIDGYIKNSAKSQSPQDLKDRWITIAEYTAKSKPLSLATKILMNALEKYPSETRLKTVSPTLIKSNNDKVLSIPNRKALVTLLEYEAKNNSGYQEEYMKNALKYVRELVFVRRYKDAYNYVKFHRTAANKEDWDVAEKNIAREDFYYNYYRTRITNDTINGRVVPGYQWDGRTSSCNPGEVPDKVQQKVLDRVNYFRRQAGVPEVIFDEELNEWCQKAVLFFESNRKLTREMSKYNKCFSGEAEKAAKFSILSEGATTTIAVTSFMADNNNAAVTNRRWLLFPNSFYMGHGSSDNYSAIWVLDDSGATDSSVYEEQFVSWPSEGFTPKMLVQKLNYWSFSLYENLKYAQVTMRAEGKNITLKTQDYVEGYGMPTVVWKPEINWEEYGDIVDFEVEVKLSNGRMYRYNVNVFKFDAESY